MFPSHDRPVNPQYEFDSGRVYGVAAHYFTDELVAAYYPDITFTQLIREDKTLILGAVPQGSSASSYITVFGGHFPSEITRDTLEWMFAHGPALVPVWVYCIRKSSTITLENLRDYLQTEGH